MEPQFWRDRWAENKIAFHEGKPNSFLAEHLDRLGGTRVLVPLCGKSEDLAFLAAHGRSVIGIELVEDAVAAFFSEHDATPTIERRGSLALYTSGPIQILAGDFFATTPADVGPIDALYDRAALVALPPDLRPRYIAHLRTLVGAAPVPVLLVAIEYPQHLMPGPPFSVPEPEVRTYYPSATLLGDEPLQSGRAAELGTARERSYLATLSGTGDAAH